MSASLKERLRCISLFSGAGGLDIGFERAGFETVSVCELEPQCAQTLRQNQGWQHSDGRVYFPEATIVQADIRDLAAKQLTHGERIDCVLGGPPCQAFSSSGKQKSVLDPRGTLVSQFVRLVDEVRPRAFLFENVRGIVTARDETGCPGGVIRKIISDFETLGYSCRAGLLNAADYGAFQRRVRCFIVGVQNGTAPQFPAETHVAQTQSARGLFESAWRTLREFLSEWADKEESNFVFPTPALAVQLADLPNGTGLKSRGVAEPTRPGGHWGYRQGTFIADLDLPARTVTGSGSQDWVRWDGVLRRLTLVEVQRLQGFPDDWLFAGTKAEVFKQVGNAVPSIFGELLARTIQSHLHKEVKSPPVRLGFPPEFEKYINYTISDHRRNESARKVHLPFIQAAQVGENGRG